MARRNLLPAGVNPLFCSRAARYKSSCSCAMVSPTQFGTACCLPPTAYDPVSPSLAACSPVCGIRLIALRYITCVQSALTTNVLKVASRVKMGLLNPIGKLILCFRPVENRFGRDFGHATEELCFCVPTRAGHAIISSSSKYGS